MHRVRVVFLFTRAVTYRGRSRFHGRTEKKPIPDLRRVLIGLSSFFVDVPVFSLPRWRSERPQRAVAATDDHYEHGGYNHDRKES